MKKAASYLFWIGILAALATPAFAETRTISWDPVTTYTDNTPIAAKDGYLLGLLDDGSRASSDPSTPSAHPSPRPPRHSTQPSRECPAAEPSTSRRRPF